MNLSTPLTEIFRLKESQKKALEKLGLKTAKDLLRHFPFRYEKIGEIKAIADISKNDYVSVEGKILKLEMEKTWRKKMPVAKGVISDGSGSLRVVWFNQPYMAKMLSPESNICLSGKIQSDKNGLYLANPLFSSELTFLNSAFGKPSGFPKADNYLGIYPETRGISSLWFQTAVKKVLSRIDFEKLKDPLPEEIFKKYHLPSLKFSLAAIHSPKKLSDANAAKKRFAFEEIFLIQLSRLKEKIRYQKQSGFPVKIAEKELGEFVSTFNFSLTQSQKKALAHILTDFKKPSPMARLLEGDVGSGKTAVAAAAAFAAVKNGYQVGYMAPTEVLARQHFKSFSNYFSPFKIKIGLITSAECLKFPSKIKGAEKQETPTHIARSQLLKWVASGETPILIGTHALIQDKIKFKNLAFAIIDEQHRFGVKQRAKLVGRGLTQTDTQINAEVKPHLLSMTATPIPRTLALTIYGDLDLTLLDEMPPGRKKIETIIVPPSQRERAYEQMRYEINQGRQAYVVCPRINADSRGSNMDNRGENLRESAGNLRLSALYEIKAVKEEYEKLSKKIFPEFKVGMLHGKMLPKEKEKTMNEFREGKINLLVATSVIEVGVDVPNATSILIEGAERFGLAQLHQLRGRVLRSEHQPYCFIFTESSSKRTLARLNALLTAKNGFELAEYDLKFRGPGELSGKKQWGISDMGMEALKNLKMVEAAREEAQVILEKDPELKNYPLLSAKIKISSALSGAHFE